MAQQASSPSRSTARSWPPPTLAAVGRRLYQDAIYPFAVDRRLAELGLFYSRIAILLRAGMPVSEAFRSALTNCGSLAISKDLLAWQREMEIGQPLAAWPRTRPDLLPATHIALLSATEQTGRFDRAFERLEAICDSELRLRRFLKLHALHAKILAGVVYFGLPLLQSLVGGGNPLAIIVYSVTELLEICLIVAVLFCIVRGLLWKYPTLADAYTDVRRSLPGIGTIAKKAEAARFARILGELYSAGIELRTALRLAAEACGSRDIVRAVARAMPRMESGENLVDQLAAQMLLPHILLESLRTGLVTGEIDRLVLRAATVLEDEIDEARRQAGFVVGQALYLLVALTVLSSVRGNFT